MLKSIERQDNEFETTNQYGPSLDTRQIGDEIGQLKKSQAAIQISIARFDEKFDAVENRLGKVESGVEKLAQVNQLSLGLHQKTIQKLVSLL